MPATSPIAFITQTVRDIVNVTGVDVVRRYTGYNGPNISAYVNVVGGTVGTTIESGPGYYEGHMTVSVLLTKFVNTSDTSDTDTEAVGEMIAIVMDAVASYDPETTAVNNDGRFKTWILGVTVTGHDGAFDNGDTKAIAAVTLDVHYHMSLS